MSTAAPATPPKAATTSCTPPRRAAFRPRLDLYRYQLTDIANPSLDLSTQVGVYLGRSDRPDDVRLRSGAQALRQNRQQHRAVPVLGPDDARPRPIRDRSVQIDSTIASLQAWLSAQSLNIQNCALEFDPGRGTFPLWCGTGVVWELHEPPSGNTMSGWTVTQRTPSSAVPPGIVGTGIMGKWHYAPYYDVFVGLEDTVRRPDLDLQAGRLGSTQSAGQRACRPSASRRRRTAPASLPRTPLSLTANASDSDGSIARVEYYANGVKLGQATVAPYTVAWTPVLVGPYAIVAVAVDNVGGMTLSPTVNITRQRDADHGHAAGRPQRLCGRERHVPGRYRAHDACAAR